MLYWGHDNLLPAVGRLLMLVVPPLIVRARITASEYTALRQLALERNEAVADTVAAALRKQYPSITGKRES